ncbi:MAG: hypothetical protein KKC79_08785 [Gammaproteobacteria bacterium]|nr:hypothetical protein [Gammaproteobacteria bacterium]MBU1441838.1 hypothetical protein [Gammaproteobacteria bacterium]MBU2408730.1 hypothetical protein [Gammaproteobacteria bacterium]
MTHLMRDVDPLFGFAEIQGLAAAGAVLAAEERPDIALRRLLRKRFAGPRAGMRIVGMLHG